MICRKDQLFTLEIHQIKEKPSVHCHIPLPELKEKLLQQHLIAGGCRSSVLQEQCGCQQCNKGDCNASREASTAPSAGRGVGWGSTASSKPPKWSHPPSPLLQAQPQQSITEAGSATVSAIVSQSSSWSIGSCSIFGQQQQSIQIQRRQLYILFLCHFESIFHTFFVHPFNPKPQTLYPSALQFCN